MTSGRGAGPHSIEVFALSLQPGPRQRLGTTQRTPPGSWRGWSATGRWVVGHVLHSAVQLPPQLRPRPPRRRFACHATVVSP